MRYFFGYRKKQFLTPIIHTEHTFMLSYQHIYHAGCLADIQKHCVLSTVLKHMTKKDIGLTYIETHAARGVYNLNAPEAIKTGEASIGINRISPEQLNSFCPTFYDVLEHTKKQFGNSFYPGSPLIAKTLLRPIDKLHLMELHPQEFTALNKNISGNTIRTYKKDGYQGSLELCPPIPRRGLILIDPSYEVKEEYQQVASFIFKAIRQWPQATILLWYPILKQRYHIAMTEQIEQAMSSATVKTWKEEILFGLEKGMDGTGMLVLNPPIGVTLPNFQEFYQLLALGSGLD